MPSYDINTKVEIKRLFVQEGRSPDFISKIFRGRPGANTVTNWADKKDEETGKTWWNLRREWENAEYENYAPANLIRKIYARINDLLDKPNFSSDSLAKELSAIRKIGDPENQVHVLYHFLTDLTTFIMERKPQLLNRELVDLFKEYRTHIRKVLNT